MKVKELCGGWVLRRRKSGSREMMLVDPEGRQYTGEEFETGDVALRFLEAMMEFGMTRAAVAAFSEWAEPERMNYAEWSAGQVG